jgi:uncharacterized membrane protein
MITFTGLVFSITMVVLQLTSSQFSPRAMRNFLQDRVSQLAMGVFVGTFAYSFVALAAVRYSTETDEPFVPAITTTGAFVLVAASILMFIQLIHHLADSVRAVNIIERFAMETRTSIDHERDRDDGIGPRVSPDALDWSVVSTTTAGVVTDIDLEHLGEAAHEKNCYVEVVPRAGNYVCCGQTLLRVGVLAGTNAETDAEYWRRFVHLGRERSMREDVAFGIRQLVDIAERALSPGINDPTTAVQCLDRIHDLLRILAANPLPSARVAVVDDTVRAWACRESFAELLHLGVAEIDEFGGTSPRIRHRLDRMLDDLADASAGVEIRRAVVEEARLLAASEPERSQAVLGS